MPTHRENVLKRLGLPLDTHISMSELSKASLIPEPALQEVFDRGIGAWKTNISSVRLKKDFSKNPNMGKYPRSARLGKEQWALARVYSFIDRGETYQSADNDIAQKYNIERTKNVNTKYKMPRKPRGGSILGAIPAVSTLYDEADAFQRAITNDTISGERRKMVKANNDSAMASARAENAVADVKEGATGGKRSHKAQHIRYMLGKLKERNDGYVKPFEPFRPNMVKKTENSPFIKNLQKATTAPSPKAPAKRGKKAKPVVVEEEEEAEVEEVAPSAPVDKKTRAKALKAEGLSTRAIAKKMSEEGYTKVSPSTVVNLLKGSGMCGSGYDEHPEDFFF